MAASSPMLPPRSGQLALNADDPSPPTALRAGAIVTAGLYPTQTERRGAGTCPKGQPLSAPELSPEAQPRARLGHGDHEARGAAGVQGPPRKVRTGPVGRGPGVGSAKLDPQETQDGEKSVGSPSHWKQVTGLRGRTGRTEARGRGPGRLGASAQRCNDFAQLPDSHWRRRKTKLRGFHKLKTNFKLQPPGINFSLELISEINGSEIVWPVSPKPPTLFC